MKKKKSRKRRVISDLNITNLVDVTFALLIIFMITAPMMNQGVQLDLPETESENVEAKELIQISINGRSEIFIDQNRISLSEFKKEFRKIFAGRTNIPVFVSADKKVPWGMVIKIISDIQNVGVVELGFLTLPISQKR